jgi:hypothetical protein
MRIGPAQLVRAGAFLAGLALAAIAVAGWRVPTHSPSGANLQMVAVGTSELEANPGHPFEVSSNLRPSGAGHDPVARVVLTNTMAQPLAVRIHALPSIPDLDALLRVKASAGGRTFFDGRLGGLRSWTRQSFVVPQSGGQTLLEMHYWLPASVRRGFQNRSDRVSIEFKLAPGGRAG